MHACMGCVEIMWECLSLHLQVHNSKLATDVGRHAFSLYFCLLLSVLGSACTPSFYSDRCVPLKAKTAISKSPSIFGLTTTTQHTARTQRSGWVTIFASMTDAIGTYKMIFVHGCGPATAGLLLRAYNKQQYVLAVKHWCLRPFVSTQSVPSANQLTEQ